jgi:uncharacterized membrane-anchored protein YhcB (DUF1043 family)
MRNRLVSLVWASMCVGFCIGAVIGAFVLKLAQECCW